MLPAPDGAPEPRVVRFGVYEFRFDTLTLSKYGLKIKLQEQPSRVLGTSASKRRTDRHSRIAQTGIVAGFFVR